jgi:two-component system chemotaxis sensor kinase CheA
MDDLLREFLTETAESLEAVDRELVRFEQEPNDSKILDNIFRLVHTIKGTCGFLGLPRLGAITHAAETLLGNFRTGKAVTAEAVTLILASIDRVKALLDALEQSGAEPQGNDDDLIGELQALRSQSESHTPRVGSCDPSSDQPPGFSTDTVQLDTATGRLSGKQEATASGRSRAEQNGKPHEPGGAEDNSKASIRVHVSTLDRLMTMVSELVLTRNQLIEIGRRRADSEFKTPLQRLSKVTAELQEGVLKTRMQPIAIAWKRLPRLIRDLAAELGKPIDLEMHGSETELDRQVLDLIKDPLTHMVRNAADHGLETSAERIGAGKPERGTIRLCASHQGGHIIIDVSDDGRGLDIDRISARALHLGLASQIEIARMSEPEIQQFIFTPGFSTLANATSISGRGIGMDVVRANIDQIGGTVEVNSVPGRGTAFVMKIPLTLAIVSALILEAAGERFAIPQLSIRELVRMRPDSEPRIEYISSTPVVRLRDAVLPITDLGALLDLRHAESELRRNGCLIVMQVGGQAFGILADKILDSEEIVVKPLASRLRHIAMFSGSTILGDGSVILILDPGGLAHRFGLAPLVERSPPKAASADNENARKESLLIFRAGSPNAKAVPLPLISRLEEIEAKKIQTSNGRRVVLYRGQLMPLVPADPGLRARNSGMQPVLVCSDGSRAMGLMIDEIVDTAEERLDIALASASPGLIGSAVIRGEATEIIDVGHFLPLAFDDWQRWNERRAEEAARSILLVDDAVFFRGMLAPVLEAAGYDVTCAASGKAALAALGSGRRFDVIITDLDMPEMDGFDLAQAVSANPRSAGIPIIGLTSSLCTEVSDRGARAGLRDFVAKFDRRGLIAALQQQTLKCA